MSTHCQDPLTCPEGNCTGCSLGETWCQDPRCEPNCQDCQLPADHDAIVNYVMIIIIALLLLIAFILWFMYYPTIIPTNKYLYPSPAMPVASQLMYPSPAMPVYPVQSVII